MNQAQIQNKVKKLKTYIEKTTFLISQATDPDKVLFFKRELRKANATLDQLNK